MKKVYTWEIHDVYSRYWTQESIEVEDTIENNDLYIEKMDIAESYLGQKLNPNDLEKWNPPLIKIEPYDDGSLRETGDFHSTWGGFGGHFVSQNMVDKIGDTLREYGQLFPLEVEDREDKLYRYWVTKEIPFESVDKEKSKFFDDEYSDDDVFKIEKLVLKENCYDNSIIFRITEEYKKTIFITGEFIELIKENDLKGFNFIPDTSYEYASQNGSTILIG